MNNKEFYRGFENRFRGSRELIIERVKVYLPFVAPLKKLYPDSMALDCGCGRGEWLEVLAAEGFNVEGVDLDAGAWIERDKSSIEIHAGDAVKYLKSLPDCSRSVVSGFHIVEHLPYEVLLAFFKEAFRVLKPGGLFILETPNIENLNVGTYSFYLDLTHITNLPADLLLYLGEVNGFVRSKKLRLPITRLADNDRVTLEQVILNVGRDTGFVAQKTSSEEHLRLFDEAFALDEGMSLNELILKFDRQISQLYAEFDEMKNILKEECAFLNIESEVLRANLGEAKSK